MSPSLLGLLSFQYLMVIYRFYTYVLHPPQRLNLLIDTHWAAPFPLLLSEPGSACWLCSNMWAEGWISEGEKSSSTCLFRGWGSGSRGDEGRSDPKQTETSRRTGVCVKPSGCWSYCGGSTGWTGSDQMKPSNPHLRPQTDSSSTLHSSGVFIRNTTSQVGASSTCSILDAPCTSVDVWARRKVLRFRDSESYESL